MSSRHKKGNEKMARKKVVENIETPYDSIEVETPALVAKKAKMLDAPITAIQNIVRAFYPINSVNVGDGFDSDVKVEFLLGNGRSIQGIVRKNETAGYYQLVLADGTDWKDDYTYLKPMDFSKVMILPHYQYNTTIDDICLLSNGINRVIKAVTDINKALFVYAYGGMKAVKKIADDKAEKILNKLEKDGDTVLEYFAKQEAKEEAEEEIISEED